MQAAILHLAVLNNLMLCWAVVDTALGSAPFEFKPVSTRMLPLTGVKGEKETTMPNQNDNRFSSQKHSGAMKSFTTGQSKAEIGLRTATFQAAGLVTHGRLDFFGATYHKLHNEHPRIAARWLAMVEEVFVAPKVVDGVEVNKPIIRFIVKDDKQTAVLRKGFTIDDMRDRCNSLLSHEDSEERFTDPTHENFVGDFYYGPKKTGTKPPKKPLTKGKIADKLFESLAKEAAAHGYTMDDALEDDFTQLVRDRLTPKPQTAPATTN